MVIRDAVRADVPQILALIRELAEYEKSADQVRTTEADLERMLIDGESGAPPLANAIHLTFTADELSLRVQQLNDVLGRLRSGGPYGYESQPSNRFEKEKNNDD